MANPDHHVTVTVGRKKRLSKRGQRQSEGPLTSVSVSGRFPVGVLEYDVRSSDAFGSPLKASEWSSAIHSVVTNCRRKGAGKGRVIYMLESGTQPAAVLAYHLESSRDLEIRGAESALAVKERERELVAALLLYADSILRKHPSRQGAASLVWPAAKGAAGDICEKYGFRVAGTMPDGRQRLVRSVRGT